MPDGVLGAARGGRHSRVSAVIGSAPYPDYEAAEAAGLAIAAEQCVTTVYISRESGMASN